MCPFASTVHSFSALINVYKITKLAADSNMNYVVYVHTKKYNIL